MNGIINVIKPSGITSNYVLTKIKKQFGVKKIGHLGTLDPIAKGVLPVTVGKATKLFDYFLTKDKEYIAEFTFGKETDTLDGQGEIRKQGGSVPLVKEIETVLPKLSGEVMQIPPQYSAKNVNGKRAYELARMEKNFILAPKKVNIYKIKLLQKISENSYSFFIHCSSGTYIRSIARDLAVLLKTYAFMSALTRTRSGQFDIENGVTLEELLNGDIEKYCIGLEKILFNFEKIELEKEYYEKLKNGVLIPFTKKEKEFLIYCGGELFGIATSVNGILKIKVNLKENTKE